MNASVGHASKQSPQPVQLSESTKATLLYLYFDLSIISKALKKQSDMHRSHPIQFTSTTTASGGCDLAKSGGRGLSPTYFLSVPLIAWTLLWLSTPPNDFVRRDNLLKRLPANLLQ